MTIPGNAGGPTAPSVESRHTARQTGVRTTPQRLSHLGAGWIAVFILALVLRAGWGLAGSSSGHDLSSLEFPDEIQYWGMANSLASGEGLKDEFGFRATRMPLYPAFLALPAWAGDGPRGVVAAKVLQWLIGATGAALTAGLGAALFGRWTGLVAGTLAAFDPFLVYFSSLLLTETLFVAALPALWWALWAACTRPRFHWRRWGLVGIAGAVCVYAKESSAGLVAVALVVAAVASWRDSRSRSGPLGPILAGAIVLLAVFPWALRNRVVLGEWCWLTTRGGVSLFDGVGPQANGASHLEGIQDAPVVQRLGEVEWNRHFWRESWRAIRQDPVRIARLAGKKLARMWNPFPNVGTYQSTAVRVLSAAWTLPLYACALGGALIVTKRDRSSRGSERCVSLRRTGFLLLPAVYFSAIHSLFVGSVRYRLATVPMLEILAAAAIMAVVDRLTGLKAPMLGPSRAMTPRVRK